MSNTEMVSVPRELAERIAQICMFTMYKEDYRAISEILAQPAEQHQGEPVAWVRVIDGEPMKYSWFGNKRLPVGKHQLYTHADPGEVEQLREGRKLLLEDLDRRDSTVAALRAQLAERDALLARALPYLSNTPDLVQHGAEDLAEEIRSASAGRPCYGPNEWGTECGKCSKCKHASAEPTSPKCGACGDTGVIESQEKDELPGGHYVERGIVACRQCEEPSAPVEHDDLYVLRELMVEYLPMAKRIPLAKAIKAAGFARAALERKP